MFAHLSGSDLQPEAPGLTACKLRVFWFIGEGLKTKQIATQLHLSVKTIETHRENIKRKLALDCLEKVICAAALWRARTDLQLPCWEGVLETPKHSLQNPS